MHSLIKTIVGFAMLTVSWLAIPSNVDQIPEMIATTSTVTSIVTTTTATTTTTTTTTPIDALCGEWWELASTVGFDDALLPTLDQVLWRESRCIPTLLNIKDPNGGSYGLAQINGFWCLPSRYYPGGYLQSVGVLDTCDDLYDPTVNLAAAYALVSYSLNAGMCTWQQWAWLEGCD